MPLQLSMKFLSLILMASVLTGCLNQIPVSEPSPTPVNNPPIADFSYNWTGGDEEQPWTCSKVTFTAEVTDPDGDYFYLLWLDNDTRIPQALGGTEFETKLWPDGIHTIKLVATDIKGAKTVVEKQINVKYEVPEPVPLKTKNGLNIAAIYFPTGVPMKYEVQPVDQGHLYSTWPNQVYTPLLGLYDITNPVTIDWHIKWALEHGVDNFWIWIAPHGNPPENVDKGSYMIYYRDGFLKAKYKDRIRFNVWLDMRMYMPHEFYKEHNPNPSSSDSINNDIEILSKYYFNQSNYNKIDGNPIVYLFQTSFYFCDNCKDKEEREKLFKLHIKSIREIGKKNGYELFLIGDLSNFFANDSDKFIIENFDAITSYDLWSARDPKKYDWKIDEKGRNILIAPYDDMIDAALKREKELSELAKKMGKVYIPFANAGFNNEKAFTNTTYTTSMVKRTNPTPEKFGEWLAGVEPLIDPTLKIFHTDFTEHTEGNAIEPTREFGFAYLDIIRDNFAIKPAGGWPLNVVPTKNCGCTEYKNWNIEIGMPPPLVLLFLGTENGLLKVLKVRKE